MAGAISSSPLPSSTSHKLTFNNFPKFPSYIHTRPCYAYPTRLLSLHSASRFSESTLCRSQGNDSPASADDSIPRGWDSALQDVVRNTITKLNSFIKTYRKEEKGGGGEVREKGGEGNGDDDWDWDRWKEHFEVVDEQERLASILKSQLHNAVHREDYDDAAKLKVAVAAAATNDIVGSMMCLLNRAINEERYEDASFIRDNTGAGLVGWWAGISEKTDPYGLIIRITAEHGRYVARSYSPRQLATDASGVPLFEIFLTIDKKGEYKQQAVYLKERSILEDIPVSPLASGVLSHLKPSNSIEDKTDVFVASAEDEEDGDDTDDGSDLAEENLGFPNILQDLIPGLKVKVLKVTAPEKVDKDMISKVIEQIMEEEAEEEEIEVEIIGEEDEVKDGSDQEKGEATIDAGTEFMDSKDQSDISLKVVFSALVQKPSSSVGTKELLRLPAKLEKKGRLSFAFSIEKEVNKESSDEEEQALMDRKSRKSRLEERHKLNRVMLDLAKFVGTEKIPSKVLKDVGELIGLTLNQAQNHQPLSGSTTFNRIEIPSSSDPLNGLYIGIHGFYSSEVIHLRRKFGHWPENDGIKESSSLEFYEYVEALKLTGDPYVPAGQVAFRAKIGKRYQLPHKGIIPEEFGVIARYKGQGRLAGPGFKKPRWVDGELVILNGKYIKGEPVIGFVYWAPEYHFLVFFNRLRLQQ